MELLDIKTLLEKAVKSADSIILVAKRIENKKVNATDANALTNSYRSAGNLYLGVVHAVENSKYTIQNTGEPKELSPEDKDRLDQIIALLDKPPSKRKSKKEDAGDDIEKTRANIC